VPAGTAAVRHRDFEDPQPGAGGAHLHLDVPAVGHFLHAEHQQQVARDGAEGAHVGVADAIEKPHAVTGHHAGGDLVPGDAAGFPLTARTRADDEVERTVADRRDQGGNAAGIVGAVTIHEHQNVARRCGLRRSKAGAAIARPGIDHVSSRGACARSGFVSTAAIGHDHPADNVAGNATHHVSDRGFLVQRRDRHDHAASHRLAPLPVRPARLSFVHGSEAPAQAATRTGRRRRLGQQALAE